MFLLKLFSKKLILNPPESVSIGHRLCFYTQPDNTAAADRLSLSAISADYLSLSEYYLSFRD